jgi:hypothetical protein
MSRIRVGFDDPPRAAAAPARPKIRAALEPIAGNDNGNGRPAPPPPEPIPARVMRFWNYDEDAHRAMTPWRYAESPNEQAVREAAESDGSWAGL